MSDDLDDEDLDIDDASFDEFDNKKEGQTLGDVWRNNPAAKIGIVIAAAIGIFAFITMFGGEEERVDPSYMTGAADVKGAPGTEEVSPIYIEAIEEKNKERVDEAIRESGSALPTPIDPPLGSLKVPEEEVEKEDPLQRWRQLQEERLQRELEQTQTVEAAPLLEDTGRSEAVQALADVMSEQMQAILESQTEEVIVKSTQIAPSDLLEQINEKKLAAAAAAQPQAGPTGPTIGVPGQPAPVPPEEETEEVVLIPAGEIEYAQLILEANSDVPGPILAQIASGPLSGSRILGSFEVQNELISMRFNTVVVDGESHSIDSIAIDPATTLPGMATEVDHRYFKRVVLPMAAAFIEGAAEAIAESGNTTINITGTSTTTTEEESDTKQEIASGIEEAGQEIRDILEDIEAETEVLVRIASGTPFGLLFLTPVTEERPVEGTE